MGNKALNKKEVLTGTSIEENDEAAPSASESEAAANDEIISRLEWKYPYSAYEKLPVKVTVTELKRYFSTEVSEEFRIQSPSIRRRPAVPWKKRQE